MKKVLYIGGFEMPDGNAAAQRVLGIGKILRELDFEVFFMGLSRKQAIDGEIDGFKYRNLAYPQKTVEWISYLTGGKVFRSAINEYRPDVVILYNHPALAIEHLCKYCHQRGIKVLADITEWYEASGNIIFKTIKNWDINRRMHKSHINLDGLICISRYLYDYYTSRGCNCALVPPTVDILQAKWHQEISPSQKIKLLYAGSPGATKDRLDLIIGALDRIKDKIAEKVVFDVIGITESQFAKTWGERKIPEYVKFHGRVPHALSTKALLEADFQIILRPDTIPNRAGFPTKFVETVTSRTLTIANLSSNIGDYLTDGKNGFVIADINDEEIENTLLRALTLSKSQIAEYKKHIDTRIFDFHNYTSALEKILN